MFRIFLITLASLLLFVQPIYSQTNISGGIFSNATWSLANSPYIVTDTVVVFPGVILTIEPGVEVRFHNHTILEIREATLMAQGTASAPILFTSNSSAPAPGAWQGLWINHSPQSVLHDCEIKWANNGVKVTNFAQRVELVRVSINHCHTGLSEWSSGYDYFIRHCEFRQNNTGINAYSIVVDSSVIAENQTGLLLIHENRITNCRIDSNAVTGFQSGGNDTLVNCSFTGNLTAIRRPGGSPTSIIKGNIIEGNGTGIYINNHADRIFCNRIANNSTHNLYYDDAFNHYSLAGNDWGLTDSALIEATIYDAYDNITNGITDFMPIDTTQCYLSPCNLSFTSVVFPATCSTCATGSAYVTIMGAAAYSIVWNTSPPLGGNSLNMALPGTYSFCATDVYGCTLCDSVVITDSNYCAGFSTSPVITAAICDSCFGHVYMDVIGGHGAVQYSWNGGPLTNDDQNFTLMPGWHTVCAIDQLGCTDCDTFYLPVQCEASFTIHPGVNQYEYVAQSVSQGNGSLVLDWNWGDGSSSMNAGPTPSHTFPGPGGYSITLTLTDSTGCTDVFYGWVQVNDCNAYFYLVPDSTPHHYLAFETTWGNGPLTYLWQWGDGGTDTIAHPSHTYAAAGTYTISLTITDSTGCTSTFTDAYSVNKNAAMIYINVMAETSTPLPVEEENQYTMFPNPAGDWVRISYTGKERPQSVKVFNLLGEAVFAAGWEGSEREVNLNEWPAGTYLVVVESASGIWRKPLIKQ